MAPSIVKNLSMGGPGWFNDGRAYTNNVLYRDGAVNNDLVIRNSGALFVTLWVDWWQFQGDDNPNFVAPTSYVESWAQL